MKRTFFVFVCMLVTLFFFSTFGIGLGSPVGSGSPSPPAPVNLSQNTWSIAYGGIWIDGGYDIQVTYDGGYIMVGYFSPVLYGNEVAWVNKLNTNGANIMQKSYTIQGAARTYFEAVRPLTDGSYIAAGMVQASGPSTTDAWVVKLNSDGTVAWQNTYDNGDGEKAHAILETADGGYIAAGSIYPFGSGWDGFAIKLNSNGTAVWQKVYHGTIISLQATSDGGYIAIGSTYSSDDGSADVFVLKLNSNGTPVWQKTYGGSSYDYGEAIAETVDGGFIAAGTTASFRAGDSDGFVMKLNSNGSVAWQKAYGGSDHEGFHSIQEVRLPQPVTEYGYVVAGDTASYSAGYKDGWILQLRNSGSIVWQRAYGGTGDQQFFSIQEDRIPGTPVQLGTYYGYVTAGQSDILGVSVYDAWAMKTTSAGALVNCPIYTNSSAVPINISMQVGTVTGSLNPSFTISSPTVVVQDTTVIPSLHCNI